MMFRKLLIANRGEIALRVIRTARALGIRTVAVYSAADREALHVRLADEAHPIGGAPAVESYLNAPTILGVARARGADALHPGYGFLAEQADFARAVANAGLVFVGPPPETLAASGDKTEARRRMLAAGVPVVPGSDGPVATVGAAREAAREIGFPVLLKPAAGGGGKGMRLVADESGLEREFSAGSREAAAAFGDGALYVERHLGRVRHVEVQVLATDEEVIALGERECSIQRRHQKLVEESPAPALAGAAGARVREELERAAVRAAQAVGYRNAGTVEFLLDQAGRVHFIEINARLQVEHPVTELVTGVDLVEAQLRIAAGEPLPPAARRPTPRGCAVECRVIAEDPARGFLPSTGTVRVLRLPAGPGVRWDGAIESGSPVTPYYDSLLGKLVVWGEDRVAALGRLRSALRELRIEGVATNVGFLRRLAADPAFLEGDLHTGFFDERPQLLAPAEPPNPERLAIAAVWEAEQRTRTFARHASPRGRQDRPALENGRSTVRSGWRDDRRPFVWIR